MVGLMIAVLVGFAGLALDLGQLYVTKTELQDAADACALAAARELTCDASAGSCSATFVNAEKAGITVASRNKTAFQSTAVTIDATDVRFSTNLSPNDSYKTSGDADASSKFTMCIARRGEIPMWFMQVLGIGPKDVSATAVATLSPAQTNCAVPINLCKPASAPASDPLQGMNAGDWLCAQGTNCITSGTGNFGWTDFTPQSGGASELYDQIKGPGVCSLPPLSTNPTIGSQGEIASLDKAWNTRFGLYQNSEAGSYSTSPPDYTGYAYTADTWKPGTPYTGRNAFGDFQAKRATKTPYQGSIPGGYVTPSSQIYQKYGTDRRLAVVPVMDCQAWQISKPQPQPILAYACVLLLHPMTGNPKTDLWIEYRGPADEPGSPCATTGLAGGPGSVGPLVPTLVQ